MSKRPTESGDWSRQSEALFRAARTEHAPTAVDRARVRSALAQRVAGSATASPTGDHTQVPTTAGTSAAAFGKLVKIGLGIACVAAGAAALMRGGDSPKPRGSRPPAAQTSEAAPPRSAGAALPIAAGAEHLPRSGVAVDDAVSVRKNRRAVSSDARGVAPVHVAPMAARARSTQTKLSTSEAPSGLSQAVAGNALPTPTLAPVPVPAPAEIEDSPDARAELAFMARINAAMVESRASTVLTLCAEHARRWPDGTFAQEREALRAVASCNSRASDARARALRFLASYPRSSLAPRVRDECGSLLTHE